jgi:hypothetical protein
VTPTPISLTPTPAAGSFSPAPSPTNVPPLVQIGEGFVTFGTRADDQLRIEDPRSVFHAGERIVWSAYLTERADSAELRIQISKLDSAEVSGERLISDSAVTPDVRNAQIFQSRIRPQNGLDGPGVYVVRYVRGTDVLAEGFVEITTR